MTAYSTITYGGQTVKIAKIPKSNMRGSVDGNQYGKPYDKTIPQGFSDFIPGYTEAIACNGGIFYSWETDTYAEGIEKSKGINNQDFYMSCVADFNEVMAVGFPYDGGVVFAKQKDIISNINSYYGAVTFCFGIMKNGQKAEWGKSEHASQYNCVSGRTILGQDAEYIYVLSIAGTTGKTGLRGNQLFGLCEHLKLTDAGCFDGGGSVWMRVDGSYKNTTTRKVKNAVLLFVKNGATEKPEEPKSDNTVTKFECNVTFKVVHGSYGTPKVKVATRPTVTGKYDTSKPVYVGDIFTVTEMASVPNCEYYIGYMKDGTQAGRWILLDPSDIVQID
jgi:hypothetical protein